MRINSQIQKERLETLYLSGKSMADIAREMNCSVHKIIYWMNKHKIVRRTRSEALYRKLNPSGDPFTITTDNLFLLGLGLGIYWGEGNKVSKHSLRVANSDPEIILVFRRFLKEVCGVKPEKIRYSLVAFNDSEVADCARFWSSKLNIGFNSFGNIVQIPPQGKGIYKKKSQFGVCTITVSNIKLKTWILDQIQKAAGMAQW